MQETEEPQVRSLSREDPLEKGTATHSRVLTREPYGQRSLVSYDWDTAEAAQHVRTQNPGSRDQRQGPCRWETPRGASGQLQVQGAAGGARGAKDAGGERSKDTDVQELDRRRVAKRSTLEGTVMAGGRACVELRVCLSHKVGPWTPGQGEGAREGWPASSCPL